MIYIHCTVNTAPYTVYLKHTRTAHAEMRVPSAKGQKMLIISEIIDVSNAVCYCVRAPDQRLYREHPVHSPILNLTVTLQFQTYRAK
jgi:hypothetical protein